MEHFPAIDSVAALVIVFAIAFLAGIVKGAVGFAMPMILISGLTLVLPPQVALAALIVPTFATNGWQALRQGVRTAVATMVRFRVFLICGFVFLVFSAQLVPVINQRVMLALIGGPVTLFAAFQLAGWHPRLAGQSKIADLVIGGFAGFIGGMSGVWGPPTVAYLTAIDTPKQEQMRAQGVIYGLGAVALFGAHIQSGVLQADTLPLSVVLILPALFGMWIGFKVQDRFDQATFRKATLAVLLIAGLNLLRRAITG